MKINIFGFGAPKNLLKPIENQHDCCWSPLDPFWSLLGAIWSPLGPIWSALGPTLVPFSPHLVSVSSHLIPIRSHLGFVLGSRKASKTSEESTLNTFRFWYPLGFVAVLGRVLQVSWAIFEASLDVLGASWSVLGRPHGVLGPSWGMLEASWGVLGERLWAFWKCLGASWVLNQFPHVLEPSQRRLGTKNQPQRPKAMLNGFFSYAFLHWDD